MEKRRSDSIWRGVAGLLFQVLIFTPPTTAWYRVVIFGAGVARQDFLSFGPRVRRLLVWQLALAIALIAPLAALGWLASSLQMQSGLEGLYLATILALIVTTIVVIVVVCRLSVVLALVAADERANLGAAWRMTKGLGTPIVAITAVVTGLVSLPVLPAQLMFGEELVIALAIENALAFVSMLALATLFAQIYLDLRETQAEAA